MTDSITVGEFQDACAAARANPSPLVVALRTGLPTPTVFNCEPSDKLFKVFGIASRLDALEVNLAGQDLSLGDTAASINRARARVGAASVVIGPSKLGKFHNSNGTVNLAEVLDAENEALDAEAGLPAPAATGSEEIALLSATAQKTFIGKDGKVDMVALLNEEDACQEFHINTSQIISLNNSPTQ